MTRLGTACTTGAILLTTAGTATALNHMWWEAGMFTVVAAFLAEGASRERAGARRRRVEAERAERLARGEQPAELPRPCCQFWASSDGAVHGHDCTRPPGARTTLTLAEQQALAEITAHYDEDTVA